ncbi:hypothetical protein HanXRQr2_Chr15g0687641 [Helianthus annuus]|uniref:Uncharacterized protein n=1 Tax=Helianthus annuus TaxID=4232 RepID=A0A9K3E182_HELAN|nr:hypothetical protein HanXRQr2_Chr15g0687641 [Helianthus annuus]
MSPCPLDTSQVFPSFLGIVISTTVLITTNTTCCPSLVNLIWHSLELTRP